MTAATAYAIMGLGLIAYALTGGADFGGGLWDLLARGPRREEQRRVIERALAPIWEANHVWVIFLIVMTFTVFPRAYAAWSVAFYVPFLLALIGIVLRGAAFVFRAYGLDAIGPRATWGRVFGVSSVCVPVFLGAILGGIAGGAVRVEGSIPTTGLWAGWCSWFGFAVGAFALTLFAYLAAVYLAAAAVGPVADDFRRRAMLTQCVAGILALFVVVIARSDAPWLYARITQSGFTFAVQGVTAAAAILAVVLLWRRRFQWARVAAAVQVAGVVAGLGLALDGMLLVPDISVDNAGARPETLAAIGPGLAISIALLIPALIWLYRTFRASIGNASGS